MTFGLCVVPHAAEKQITLISIHSFASFYCTALLDVRIQPPADCACACVCVSVRERVRGYGHECVLVGAGC